MTIDANRRSPGSAPRVATLNKTHPTTDPVVLQVRADHADWYYDMPEGYIRYYRGSPTLLYEHRLVAARAFGEIPEGYIVRHLNDDRTDNRPENLRLISRAQNMLRNTSHEPARLYTCSICDKPFKAQRNRVERSSSGQLFCSPECRQMAQRKVPRPSAETLQQLMIEIGNWTTLAKQFGVSDNAAPRGHPEMGQGLWSRPLNLQRTAQTTRLALVDRHAATTSQRTSCHPTLVTRPLGRCSRRVRDSPANSPVRDWRRTLVHCSKRA